MVAGAAGRSSPEASVVLEADDDDDVDVTYNVSRPSSTLRTEQTSAGHTVYYNSLNIFSTFL